MTDTITRRRRVGAGVAAGALVTAGLLFAPSAQAATTVTNVREKDIASTAAPYSGWHQGVTDGTYRVINEGLELTGASDVVYGYAVNTATDLGPTYRNVEDLTKLSQSSVTVMSGSAVLEVGVFSSNIAGDQFTTLSPVADDDGEWTSSDVIGAGAGAIAPNTPTPLADIIAAIGPNYRVRGFGLSNTAPVSVVKDITFNDTQYTFGNNAPVARSGSLTTTIDQPIIVDLYSTDIDGNELTYTATVDTGTLSSGPVVHPYTPTGRIFTPAPGFKGTATVTYTVTDNRGGTSTGVFTINVVKHKGAVDIYRVHPSKPSIRSTVSVYATVKTDGKNAAKGSTVYLYVKGKRVATGKVNSVGKVKLKLPKKLPHGKSTIKITQAGSSKLSGGSDSYVVRVRK